MHLTIRNKSRVYFSLHFIWTEVSSDKSHANTFAVWISIRKKKSKVFQSKTSSGALPVCKLSSMIWCVGLIWYIPTGPGSFVRGLEEKKKERRHAPPTYLPRDFKCLLNRVPYTRVCVVTMNFFRVADWVTCSATGIQTNNYFIRNFYDSLALSRLLYLETFHFLWLFNELRRAMRYQNKHGFRRDCEIKKKVFFDLAWCGYESKKRCWFVKL